jgi:signal transduction histidine kinase
MQALAKSPARITKFVPHSTGATANRISPILKPERFDQLAHDARNMLSALRLYCDLLAEPGVLTSDHGHYAQELLAVTETASRLVERLAAPRRTVSRRSALKGKLRPSLHATSSGAPALGEPWPGEAVDDLGAELRGMRPLLAAIAGPAIELEIETMSCGGRTWLSKEDLTRVMLNLARNAADAMPDRGRLRITAQYGDGLSFVEAGQIPVARPRSVVITVEDTGPGITDELREEIFKAGFTTHTKGSNWPGIPHNGLGLTIVRSLIEAAGGTVRAASSPAGGARLEVELPITSGMYELLDKSSLVADSSAKGCIECP